MINLYPIKIKVLCATESPYAQGQHSKIPASGENSNNDKLDTIKIKVLCATESPKTHGRHSKIPSSEGEYQ